MLRIIKKGNPSISAVYARNGIIYYKLHSEAINKPHIINEGSDLALIKSGTIDATLNANSTKKTIEQPTTAYNK